MAVLPVPSCPELPCPKHRRPPVPRATTHTWLYPATSVRTLAATPNCGGLAATSAENPSCPYVPSPQQRTDASASRTHTNSPPHASNVTPVITSVGGGTACDKVSPCPS